MNLDSLRVLALSALFLHLAAPGGAAPSRAAAGVERPPVAAASGSSEAGRDGEGDSEGGSTEKEPWDIENPPGPVREVEIDTTEGTWMSVDVSPDGSEIVFDLLGDLYRLPIGGGDAVALTAGLAWDMQPRYSPDGDWIAFTSDRAGGDNVWIVRRDGSDPRQVTKEDFRLLNSPAWSPDGQWIAARKHFTGTRSLGSGEIWLVHRSGGEGARMTDKPDDQKDVGEPAFSPDGRWVYFSQDTTPGDVFEYNKDPNAGIYTIRRLDRETGHVEEVVGGAGGAVRPTPSPEGDRLAFVRRIREKSALVVRELESGRERVVLDDLDKDQQETWAIHGVYPGMSWTPDGSSIVHWAGGRLRRVDVESGEVGQIPFRVRQTHRIVEAVRFPVDVAPERFPVRMLRWARVSPEGDRVVFQALGRLWIRDLPDGVARRLTEQEEHQEIWPSWSRDGRHVVYATWSEEELGAVRILEIPSRGTATGRRLTEGAGHWVEPVLSPDGRTVVARKVEGSWLTSRLYSGEPGLYRIVVGSPGEDASDPVRIALRGRQPHFGPGSERVYAIAVGAEERELLSFPLRGSDVDVRDGDVRTHATSDNATEMHVSPDGRWLAFRERFRVFLVPFTDTGRPLEIGPKEKSLPRAVLARDAGNYLHWSGDSRRLHWTLGPDLYSREVRHSFSFVEGAPEKLPEPVAEGRSLGFDAETARPDGLVALVGGRVLTMLDDADGRPVIVEDGVVLVEGDRIRAVGPRSGVEIPDGARVVDVEGHSVLPGLVDVHWHGGQGSNGIVPERNWQNWSSLAFGVTTIHDPSTDTATFFAAAEMAKAGRVVAPRMFSTGQILYGAETSFRAIVEGPDDARFHVERLKRQGAISVKSYNQPRRDQRQQILAAARDLRMMVLPEGGSLFQHNMTMVADGHTGIEHAVPVAPLYDDVLQLWSATEVGYTPTLVVGYGGIWGENWWYAETDVWANERLLRFTPRELVDPIARRPFVAPPEEYHHDDLVRTAKELLDRGVSVQMGAHGQREGLGAHWELWMLAENGFTAWETLQAGTIAGARYLGMDGELGTVEVGKLADLIVVEGDVLEDIRRSESVLYTMLGGRLWRSATMDEVHPIAAKRRPFSFEE